MIYIVLGVSGVGKTTIGQALAKALNLPFYDADDYHPVSNINKMKQGIALQDEDRLPWLSALANHIVEWNKEGGAVLACSALKEKYRIALQVLDQKELVFIFLNADAAVILERLKKRTGHFMNPDLLTSQFDALEKPTGGLHIDASKPQDIILKNILEHLQK